VQIKPDGVQRSLVGEIIKRFEQKGYYLRGLKYKNVEKELAEEHYVDLASKPFYSSLVEYIGRWVHCSQIWEIILNNGYARRVCLSPPPLDAEKTLLGKSKAFSPDAMRLIWIRSYPIGNCT